MRQQMRAQKVEWGEDYREAGVLALKAVLEQGMGVRAVNSWPVETAATILALPYPTHTI